MMTWSVLNGVITGIGIGVWIGNLVLWRQTWRAVRQAREYRQVQLAILVSMWNCRAWPHRVAAAHYEAGRDWLREVDNDR